MTVCGPLGGEQYLSFVKSGTRGGQPVTVWCSSGQVMQALVFVQSQQESFIIETQTYCRDKLIDVMKVPTRDETAGILA